MAKCWESRPCDEDMQSRCPHNNPGERCSSRCGFARCDRPSHQATSDPALIFDLTVDRAAAIKEQCTFCSFFLTNGPRIAGPA
jgi:hypothetical protein